MITLCIETATARAGIALTREGRLVAETLQDAPGGLQNRLLLPMLQRLLTDSCLTFSDVDLFACAACPGSFTGIRTGIAAVQGLALAQGKPCIALSSLAMLAMNLPHTGLSICPMLDARKNEVYTALYRVTDHPEVVINDCVAAPADFLSHVSSPTLFLGEGAARYHDLIVKQSGAYAIFAAPFLSVLRPASGCRLAEHLYLSSGGVPPEQLLPTYLRLSEAELSRQSKF